MTLRRLGPHGEISYRFTLTREIVSITLSGMLTAGAVGPVTDELSRVVVESGAMGWLLDLTSCLLSLDAEAADLRAGPITEILASVPTAVIVLPEQESLVLPWLYERVMAGFDRAVFVSRSGAEAWLAERLRVVGQAVRRAHAPPATLVATPADVAQRSPAGIATATHDRACP